MNEYQIIITVTDLSNSCCTLLINSIVRIDRVYTYAGF
jgi:hypothetical protein